MIIRKRMIDRLEILDDDEHFFDVFDKEGLEGLYKIEIDNQVHYFKLDYICQKKNDDMVLLLSKTFYKYHFDYDTFKYLVDNINNFFLLDENNLFRTYRFYIYKWKRLKLKYWEKE